MFFGIELVSNPKPLLILEAGLSFCYPYSMEQSDNIMFFSDMYFNIGILWHNKREQVT